MELDSRWPLTKEKKKKKKILDEYREKMQKEKNENKNEVNLCVGGQKDYQIPSNVEMCCPPEER